MMIYKITNKQNGKMYIGQTCRLLSDRWYIHRRNAENRVKIPLASAIVCHGVENFSIEKIDTADSIEELNEKEILYIDKYNTKYPNGYNLKDGGRNGKHSEKTKAKMSNSHWSKKPEYKNPNKGKSLIHKRHKNWKEFSVFDKDDNCVGTWKSQSKCARDLGLNQGNIGSCLRGERETSGGYTFNYIKDNN